MRRNNRKPKKKDSLNTILYITSGVFVFSLILFIFTYYSYSKKYNLRDLNSEYLAQFNNEIIDEEVSEASSKIGKTIEEKKENTEKVYSNEEENKKVEEKIEETKQIVSKKTNDKKEENKKELEFIKPVEGDIIKEFSKDELIYSETLKEWMTHYGIDIKAENGTDVKASEDGEVEAIKNDPRYGLTIIIKHENGYKTLYANLLTTEFVAEGQNVYKGETIATVGDSAVYEIVDESHLHFEIIKDSENLNPIELIKK